MRPDAVILHSDRGSQYTSHEYQRFLADHNITSRMSAVATSMLLLKAVKGHAVCAHGESMARYWVDAGIQRIDVIHNNHSYNNMKC